MGEDVAVSVVWVVVIVSDVVDDGCSVVACCGCVVGADVVMLVSSCVVGAAVSTDVGC